MHCEIDVFWEHLHDASDGCSAAATHTVSVDPRAIPDTVVPGDSAPAVFRVCADHADDIRAWMREEWIRKQDRIDDLITIEEED